MNRGITIRRWINFFPLPERSTVWPEALWGSLLYWLALPGPGKPVILAWLGWIACFPWIYLITRRSLTTAAESHPAPSAGASPANSSARHPTTPSSGRCPAVLRFAAPAPTVIAETAARDTSRPTRFLSPQAEKLRRLWSRPYFQLWAVWFGFWLVTLHWLRYPHPAVAIGWIALSAYLAIYLPLFVAISRLGVHRLRLPTLLVAPTVWTALEYVRAHLLTGFALASLAHTQFRMSPVLQICDVAGQYGLSFAMVLFAAAFVRAPKLAPLVLIGVIGYGLWRYADPRPVFPPIRTLIVQGSVDVVFPPPPGTAERMHREYWELSRRGVSRFPNTELIIWPETVYGQYLVDGTPDALPPPDWPGSVPEFRDRLVEACQASREHLYTSAILLRAPLIVGINRQEWTREGPKIYNAAVFVPLRSQVLSQSTTLPKDVDKGTQEPIPSPLTTAAESADENKHRLDTKLPEIVVYDKLHLVMFGEYVPFARYLEGLIELRPLSTLFVNTEPGQGPVCFVLGHAQMVPNICFESTVPHLIRRQLRTLRREGYRPNILVNLTNDGWFRGAAALDLHLACSVFRAVEFRKPHLIAANTGISAFVDSSGVIRQVGKRRQEDLILAHVVGDDRETIYLLWGDWFAQLCLAGTAAVAAWGMWQRKMNRNARR